MTGVSGGIWRPSPLPLVMVGTRPAMTRGNGLGRQILLHTSRTVETPVSGTSPAVTVRGQAGRRTSPYTRRILTSIWLGTATRACISQAGPGDSAARARLARKAVGDAQADQHPAVLPGNRGSRSPVRARHDC